MNPQIILHIMLICLLAIVGSLYNKDHTKLIQYKKITDSLQQQILLNERVSRTSAECAYVEGQIDAINKDIRIRKGKDNYWYWIKTQTKNGEPTLFDPSWLGKK